MGRAPCCDKDGLKKGPWTPEEDQKLIDYIKRHGHGSWRALPKQAGLLRCGKSCRLRWTNYLRPDIKRGKFSFEEEQTIIQLHGVMGNKWSAIAAHLPGRTDNEIKNYWNTHLKKRLLQMGIDPVTHRRRMDLIDFTNMNQFLGPAVLDHMTARWENARLQEAMAAEYYLRQLVSAAMIQQQQTDSQNAGAIHAAEHLMRSQVDNSLSRPEFCTINPIMSQIWAQYPENHLGSPDNNNNNSNNTLASQALEQLQSQAQIMKNTQNSSPTSTLHGLKTSSNIKVEQQYINNAPHSASMINTKDCLISDQTFNSNEGYNNLLNDSTLMLQPSEGHEINSSLALDASLLWPEKLFGISQSDSDSVPALISSTSSTNIFSDSDLVPDVSSMLNMNVSSSRDTTTTPTSTNGLYTIQPEFFLSLPEASKQTEQTIDMHASENGRDYWSNMLKYVAEGSVNNNSGVQSISTQ